MKRAIIIATFLFAAAISIAAPANRQIPDFTKGDAIPAKAKHDWNLGPTGLRGWIYCDKMVTTDARQISITKVEKGGACGWNLDGRRCPVRS